MLLLLGRAQEALDRRSAAGASHTAALSRDFRLVESLLRMSDGALRPPAELSPLLARVSAAAASAQTEAGLLEGFLPRLYALVSHAPESLDADSQLSGTAAAIAAAAALEMPQHPPAALCAAIAKPLPGQAPTGAVAAAGANIALDFGFYEEATRLCAHALEKDPYDQRVLPPLLAALLQLGRKSELFALAHRLSADGTREEQESKRVNKLMAVRVQRLAVR
jgi:hypothetical protein